MKTFEDLNRGDRFFWKSEPLNTAVKVEIFDMSNKISTEFGYTYLNGTLTGTTFKIDQVTSNKSYNTHKNKDVVCFAG